MILSLLDKISSEKNLLLFNLEIIKWVLKIMKIKTSYKLSSEMNIHKKELKYLKFAKFRCNRIFKYNRL